MKAKPFKIKGSANADIRMVLDKQKQFKKLFPKGWKLERVYQVTDPKGNPRAWSSEFGVAVLMAHKALMYDKHQMGL